MGEGKGQGGGWAIERGAQNKVGKRGRQRVNGSLSTFWLNLDWLVENGISRKNEVGERGR